MVWTGKGRYSITPYKWGVKQGLLVYLPGFRVLFWILYSVGTKFSYDHHAAFFQRRDVTLGINTFRFSIKERLLPILPLLACPTVIAVTSITRFQEQWPLRSWRCGRTSCEAKATRSLSQQPAGSTIGLLPKIAVLLRLLSTLTRGSTYICLSPREWQYIIRC